MAYKASHQFARIAPRKARLVADMVRGMPVDSAASGELVIKKARRGLRIIGTGG